jgi:hypothetical protein
MSPLRAARSSRARVGTLTVALVLLGLLVAACAGAAETPPGAAFTPPPRSSDLPATSASAGPLDSADLPESPVAGVVTSIDATSLTDVKGFTLRTTTGDDLTFVIGTLENGDEFPPGHLAEHLAAAAPILVYFRVQDGKLVAYRLEDAG